MSCASWMRHESITGHHVHRPSQFSVANSLVCYLGGGRKPENLEEIHVE